MITLYDCMKVLSKVHEVFFNVFSKILVWHKFEQA